MAWTWPRFNSSRRPNQGLVLHHERLHDTSVSGGVARPALACLDVGRGRPHAPRHSLGAVDRQRDRGLDEKRRGAPTSCRVLSRPHRLSPSRRRVDLSNRPWRRLARALGRAGGERLAELDVAMGGQGAPLVPLADQMLFGDWDVALNLGGFANLSMDNATGTRVAWDVGPANLLLNRVVQTVGLDMDRDGAMAAEGSVLPHLLETWQSLSFHSQAAPKSLGREWLEKEVWPHAEHALQGHALNDVLATAVAYASWAVTRDVPSGSRILVTGGGACNPTLMAAMRQATLDRDVTWHVLKTRGSTARRRWSSPGSDCFVGWVSPTPCPASRALGWPRPAVPCGGSGPRGN